MADPEGPGPDEPKTDGDAVPDAAAKPTSPTDAESPDVWSGTAEPEAAAEEPAPDETPPTAPDETPPVAPVEMPPLEPEPTPAAPPEFPTPDEPLDPPLANDPPLIASSEARTVFMPAGTLAAQAADGWTGLPADGAPASPAQAAEGPSEAPPSPAETPPEASPDPAPAATVYQPAAAASESAATVYQPSPLRTAAPTPPSALPAPPTATNTGVPRPARTTQGRVEVGMVLNHIYLIKRHIARGGMGEVFEAVNVNDELDRVAVKVMLPSLAEDPNVQKMFFAEATKLRRLAHPAVVRYIVMAKDPELEVFFIAVEFIDGENLGAMLGRLKPSAADLKAFIRRMCEGLKAAHDLDAVHRDMSLDNVMLPSGRLDRAKIIDFGIAKDLDPSKGTVVGDGFAGKLGFAAPEQFGEYSRNVGPWTDIYSLGLVILALAGGKPVDMGQTISEAIDRRRAGPDVSVMPPELRPLLSAMVAADPAKRPQSMEAVIAALDSAVYAPGAAAAEKGAAGGKSPPEKRKGPPWALIVGGGLAVVAVVVAAIWVVGLLAGGDAGLGRPGTAVASGGGAAHPTTPAGGAGGAAAPMQESEAARRAIEASLKTVPCAWLDIRTGGENGAVQLFMAGAAGDRLAASKAVEDAAGRVKVRFVDIKSDDVSQLDHRLCDAVSAFNAIRRDTSLSGSRLTSAQPFYHLENDHGVMSANAVITLSIRDPSLDFVLLGLDPSGEIEEINFDDAGKRFADRAGFTWALTLPPDQTNVTALGDDSFNIKLYTSHAGLSGLVLITGKGPFPPAVVSGVAAHRGPGWAKALQDAAAANGWRTDMVWYETKSSS